MAGVTKHEDGDLSRIRGSDEGAARYGKTRRGQAPPALGLRLSHAARCLFRTGAKEGRGQGEKQ
eukprot:scaffold94240_cov69-Phaeocystis_antarctica.AAC.3